MPVNQLGVTRQTDQYKQQQHLFIFFDILNSIMNWINKYFQLPVWVSFFDFSLSVCPKTFTNERNVSILIPRRDQRQATDLELEYIGESLSEPLLLIFYLPWLLPTAEKVCLKSPFSDSN